MSIDDEIRLYLQALLDHPEDCQAEGCPSCVALHGLLETVRCRIFSGRIFPGVMIGNPKPAAPQKPKAREQSVLT